MRSISITKRIVFLLTFILIFILALGTILSVYMRKIEEKSLVAAEELMSTGYKRTLKYSVETLASELGREVALAKEKGLDPVEAIREDIKPVRYGENGYYFVYNTLGVNMAHPLNPKFHGQNRISHKDTKGNPYIRELCQKAQEGGGFVTYWFNKPGQDVPSPKLAFAKMIPGTDYWVATGIYIDDITAENARLSAKLTGILTSAYWQVGIGFGLVFILMVLPLSFHIVKSILSPLKEATAKAQEVADGNLNTEVVARGNDEITRLEKALGLMITTLSNNIEEIQIKGEQAQEQARMAEEMAKEAEDAKTLAENKQKDMRTAAQRLEEVVNRISAASEKISSQAYEISSGADTQSKRIAETAAAMEQMNATVLEVARNSSNAAEMGSQARQQAQSGAEVVRESVEVINTTHNHTQSLKSQMDILGRQAESIGEIMTVIEDIADQTNLLALNAAIEAARAGEAGRGFAVVADEVRKLAEKTMGATSQVGESIKSIQQVTSRNIESVDCAVQDLDQAVNLSNQSGAMLQEIVNQVEKSSDQIQQIATAAEEQSATSEQINHTIEEVNNIVRETATGASQTAQAVEDLTEQMRELQTLIHDFNTQ